jgi:hypothetical protein
MKTILHSSWMLIAASVGMAVGPPLVSRCHSHANSNYVSMINDRLMPTKLSLS